MSMLRPMRDELFKYRKRKIILPDGSVPGLPHAHFRSTKRYVSGVSPSSGSMGRHHDSYILDNPREYRPNLNAPAVHTGEYSVDSDWEYHQISHPTDPRLFKPFPELPVMEKNLSYEKSRMASEFFLKVMEAMYNPFEDSSQIPTLADIWKEHSDIYDDDISSIKIPLNLEELTPEDIAKRFMDITSALGHLQKVLQPEHPDILNLRAALHDILDDQEATSKLESLAGEIRPSKLGTDDPYANNAFEEIGQNLEQQTHTVENVFESIETAQPDMLNEQLGTMFEGQDFETFSEQENLDQKLEQEDSFAVSAFIEQDMMHEEMAVNMDILDGMSDPIGYDADSIADEINHAIDEITQQSAPEEEPDPFQPLYAPYMIGQDMFGQMQYMVDPFAMPDLYGPIGPGPMGPMPGP